MGSANNKGIKVGQVFLHDYFQIFYRTNTPMILIKRNKFGLIEANESFFKLTGFSRSKNDRNSSIMSIFPETQPIYQNKKTRDFLKEKLNCKHRKGSNNKKIEFVISCKQNDGKLFDALMSITPIQLWKNKVYQVLLSPIQKRENRPRNFN
ncbi:hypothetical protein M0813_18510 [Anaeramoeba flamelloides]|uniref:PAS domain-containing protein n=1 Tax=Anaeramoeba flamelloides TaxID=1746091 RepID=A0AAV7ZEC0_9EUKA|nr:hypothetical protein M0812_14735 [Anaeramoeba flamelloides]KAJ6247875.1 hypothetical protein M0813_18510 [Anaeramoeba flamelloides]